jgi:hypothetical protein
VRHLDGKGPKDGLPLIGGELGDLNLSVSASVGEPSPSGGTNVLNPIGVFDPANGVLDTVDGDDRDGVFTETP